MPCQHGQDYPANCSQCYPPLNFEYSMSNDELADAIKAARELVAKAPNDQSGMKDRLTEHMFALLKIQEHRAGLVSMPPPRRD